VSFILLALAASALAAGAGFIAARRANKREEPGLLQLPPPPEPEVSADERALARALPLALGDVVSVEEDVTGAAVAVKMTHNDRWLEGGIAIFDGSEPVAVVYLAPEGDRQEAVAAFALPRREIGWLSPTAAEIGSEAPTSIELAGVVLTRKRRLAVRLVRIGRAAPRLGESGTFAEYEASGDLMAIVLRGSEGTAAWLGKHYAEGRYDRMGSGNAP
jgi:hypothetical protein